MSNNALSTTYEVRDGVAIIQMDLPPVNSQSPELRQALHASLVKAGNEASVAAVVLAGRGRMFCGGADIKEFESADIAKPDLNDICALIESMSKPVIAAIHGMALGGGLEIALSCHHRVALSGTKLGLPEVSLGILPGAGGTQRLPRLAGVEKALEMILSGKPMGADEALASGLVDVVVDDALIESAARYARKVLDNAKALRVTSALPVDVSKLSADFFPEQSGIAQRSLASTPAYAAIVASVQAAAESASFSQGLAFEWARFTELMQSPQSRALRHLFFAQREASKLPGLSRDIKPRSIKRVGIVGAGTMGGGIAMNFISAGIPVTILDTSQASLDRGLSIVRKNYQGSVDKGRISARQMESCMALLTGTLDYADLAEADLVIEAVFEDFELKKQVCAKLGQVCKPGAIIASNTSTLDIDALAVETGRPADVLGMHFFSPANIMKLLEIVRGAETAPDVLATAMSLAKVIGKIAVVSGVCYGFIGNRMLEGYLRETDFLLLEGATPQQIDRALESFGMAMGPCRMMDMSGVDVNANVLEQRALAGGLPDDPAYRKVCRHLYSLGRTGQKSGSGYYRYEGRTLIPDADVDQIIAQLAAELGIERRTGITDKEIVERCLLPLINEGYRILEEGIAYRASDIDVVWTAGYGFPKHRGGPMHYAGQVGLETVRANMLAYGRISGDTHAYWAAAPLIEQQAAAIGL